MIKGEIKTRILLSLAFFLSLSFSSCTRNILSVHTDYVTRESLASYYVETPDPLLQWPPFGQRLIISWNIPRDLFKELFRVSDQVQDQNCSQVWEPHLEITVRFRAAGLISSKVPLSEAKPDRSIAALNEESMVKAMVDEEDRSDKATASGTLDEIKPVARTRKEQVYRLPICKPSGTGVYSLLNEKYIATQGIATYRIRLMAKGCVYEEWRHQLWTDLILFEAIPEEDFQECSEEDFDGGEVEYNELENSEVENEEDENNDERSFEDGLEEWREGSETQGIDLKTDFHFFTD